MYSLDVTIRGVAPLLQCRYPVPDLATLSKGARQVTGAPDYTEEWRDKLYVTSDDELYEPSSHIEAAMIAAAANFKIAGRRGKTYKDLFKAAVFVSPEMVPHGLKAPDTLDTDADKRLYLDVRPVVINRSRIVRIRPAFKAGWTLAFTIDVIDDQIAQELLHDILTLAGRTVGIGDYRPKFGRFQIVRFAAGASD